MDLFVGPFVVLLKKKKNNIIVPRMIKKYILLYYNYVISNMGVYMGGGICGSDPSIVFFLNVFIADIVIDI